MYTTVATCCKVAPSPLLPHGSPPPSLKALSHSFLPLLGPRYQEAPSRSSASLQDEGRPRFVYPAAFDRHEHSPPSQEPKRELHVRQRAAILGQQGRVSLDSEAQQEMNLARLYEDVAGFAQTVTTPMPAQLVIDRAVWIAKSERCPTAVILPADVQNLEMAEPDREHWVSRTGVGHASTRLVPLQDELERAADVLNAGKKVAMLVGQSVLEATDEVIAVADRLGAGIATVLLGKGAVPAPSPTTPSSSGCSDPNSATT